MTYGQILATNNNVMKDVILAMLSWAWWDWRTTRSLSTTWKLNRSFVVNSQLQANYFSLLCYMCFSSGGLTSKAWTWHDNGCGLCIACRLMEQVWQTISNVFVFLSNSLWYIFFFGITQFHIKQGFLLLMDFVDVVDTWH
jgi:hypothetical protein